MKRNSWLAASLTLCLLAYAARDAMAFNSIKNNWKTYYGASACPSVVAVADACLLCHSDPNVNPVVFNPYGDLLISNNRNFAAADGVDSDGDGRTNHQEITQDCTLPGDVTSPADATSWGALKVIYR